MANKGKNMPNTKRRTLLSLVKDKFSQLTDKEKEKLLETNIVGDFREFKYVKVGDLHLPFYQRQDLRLNLLFGALNKVGEEWGEMADFMLEGHVEYKPLRANPMRSGSQFVYQRARLDLTLYFPESIFEYFLKELRI